MSDIDWQKSGNDAGKGLKAELFEPELFELEDAAGSYDLAALLCPIMYFDEFAEYDR